MKDRAKALAELGSEIRRIREEKGLTLEDVTEVVKIRTNFLEDIENGNFDRFPSGVYIRGFIQSYLRFLGAEELWSQYKPYLYSEEIIDTSELVLGTLTPPTRGFRHTSRFWLIIMLLIVIAGLAFYGISLWKGKESSPVVAQRQQTVPEEKLSSVEENVAGPSNIINEPENPGEDNTLVEVSNDQTSAVSSLSETDIMSGDKPVSDDMISAVPSTENNDSTGMETEAEKILPEGPSILVMSTTRDCWVSITTDDESIFQGIIKGDETREFEINEKVNVTYGRPASINITFMGEDLGNPGTGGNVEKWFYSPDGDKGRIND